MRLEREITFEQENIFICIDRFPIKIAGDDLVDIFRDIQKSFGGKIGIPQAPSVMVLMILLAGPFSLFDGTIGTLPGGIPINKQNAMQ